MSERDDFAAWLRQGAQWRNPAQIIAQWEGADQIDAGLLRSRVSKHFWDVVEQTGITLLVSREYEHLLMALSVRESRPHVTFMVLPHPSGIAVDRERAAVFVASTRNPNQVYELRPTAGALARLDVSARSAPAGDRPLVPIRSSFFPGSLYIHDLALIGGRLHASAVGHNAVVELNDDGGWRPLWWPKAIERRGRPDFRINYLQLNSIAAGPTLDESFFSASADRISTRRPGHLNFPVDGRGVIFSGATRQPAVGGLTRPHSARLHGGRLWVANSGYGELSLADDGRAAVFARLPGWTRGLCFAGGFAFVGTSRVIPRFRAYAPGLTDERSVCGIHAVDLATGEVVAAMTWPEGNQIFAVDWLPRSDSTGLPFALPRKPASARQLFYTFDTDKGVTP